MIKPETYRFPLIVKCVKCNKDIGGFMEVDDSAVIWGIENFYLFEKGIIRCQDCEFPESDGREYEDHNWLK